MLTVVVVSCCLASAGHASGMRMENLRIRASLDGKRWNSDTMGPARSSLHSSHKSKRLKPEGVVQPCAVVKRLAMILLAFNTPAQRACSGSEHLGACRLHVLRTSSQWGLARPARTSTSISMQGSPFEQVFNSLGKLLPPVRATAKQQLLDAIRGGAGDFEVKRLFFALESMNPVDRPLTSSLLPGDWYLAWTTSRIIAGAKRPTWLRPVDAPLQRLDIESLCAENAELLTPLRLRSSVDVELSRKAGDRGVNAKFTRFRIGPVSVPAPDGLRGELDVTYLDEQLRLSRGDKGNFFVLLRNSPEADELWCTFQKSL